MKPKSRVRCAFKLRAVLLLTILLLWLLSVGAQAQQPFTTDDTDVTPRGVFHFEFFNSHDLLRPSALPAHRQNAASFELAYGLVERVEVGVEVPIITIFNVDGITPRCVVGVGDTNLSVKYNFLREREGSPFPALTISGNFEMPTGDVERGLGSGIPDYSLNGVAQKSLTSRTVARINAGIIFSGNTVTGAEGIRVRGPVLTGGASLVRRFGKRLYLGAEAFGARSSKPDLGADQFQIQMGGNYFLRDNFSVDFGVLTGLRTPDPRVGLQIGFAFDF